MKDNQMIKKRRYFGNYLNKQAYNIATLNILTGKKIKVEYDEGENWGYAWISDGKGKGHIAVF